MTALNWILTEELIILSGDTLVSSKSKNGVITFGTKIYYIAHAKTLIAVTGRALILPFLVGHLSESSLCNDVEDVALCATPLLKELDAHLSSNDSQKTSIEDNPITSTVYGFGWTEEQKISKGFAFRSTNNYVAEPLPYGLGVKPQTKIEGGSIEPFDEFMIKTIKRQREEDVAKNPDDSVGIGGKIVYVQLSSDGRCEMRLIYQFPDYMMMYNESATKIATPDS